jgi:hypothetical protein
MTHAKQAPVTPVSPEAIERANATPEISEGLPGRSQSKQKRKSGVTNEPDGLKRVELRATEEFVSALEALAKKENSSKADIIRKGSGPLCPHAHGARERQSLGSDRSGKW